MRTICDVCEGAPAILFCAADEAALCAACDDKVHKCNKLASRHVRVGLADPSEVPRCDICENAPAFFYCEIDGSSLCLQCDMIVHVGGKRTHGRYLLLRQKIEFPGDKSGNHEDGAVQCNRTGYREQNHMNRTAAEAQTQSNRMLAVAASEGNADNNVGTDSDMIDLNARPRRTHDPAPNSQVHRLVTGNKTGNEGAGVVPLRHFRREHEK